MIQFSQLILSSQAPNHAEITKILSINQYESTIIDS